MGGYYGLAVLVGVALLLPTGQCDVSCTGRDGQAGEAGAAGRDGYPGLKGQKGEPAVTARSPVDASVLLRLKGEPGDRGAQGIMGPKGYSGHLGEAGQPGRPGPEGRSFGHGEQQVAQQAGSAFSAIRTDSTYPSVGQKVSFQRTVVNTNEDFDIATGQFTCRVPGVYYFTFHSVAKVSMCLYIGSDALTDKLGFCDYNKNIDQVLSGGVVLQLAVGQKVWLESFKELQTPAELKDSREKQIIFNGFLVSANPE